MNETVFEVEPVVEAQSRPDPVDMLHWKNDFAALPAAFHTRLSPTPLPAPYRVAVSDDAASLIGLISSDFDDPEVIASFAGNRIPRGAASLAAVYSGHQFGIWAGQLGDGRAHLLGGVDTGHGLWEFQLKGAGQTPYSRMGDGRAVLRSSIREFLCSEAMHGLGIPTTRALCVIGSDLPVVRETVETAAVVTRMAPSFVRFGSFEHWANHDQPEPLKLLADYVIDSFFPFLRDDANPYQALLTEVTRRTARLVAQWQAVGFCHGVMNTDNMSILGLTLDYGPFGFLDGFDANHICNHSDHQGRYAYGRQPQIAHWNLYCLAQALLPLVGSVEDAQAALEPFKAIFTAAMDDAMHAKLGLVDRQAEDESLFEQLFALLQESRADFTIFFRRLADLGRAADSSNRRPGADARDLFLDRERFDVWATPYTARVAREGRDPAARRLAMNAVNPKYVLRNHLAEEAIEKARGKDFSEVERLLRILQKPFDEQPEHERYAALPPDWAGTLKVSCSS